jgi:hypothetical protein
MFTDNPASDIFFEILESNNIQTNKCRNWYAQYVLNGIEKWRSIIGNIKKSVIVSPLKQLIARKIPINVFVT